MSGRLEPFEGVVLGPLLGKGSFGRVYRALWNGRPVAVKARTPGSLPRSRSGGDVFLPAHFGHFSEEFVVRCGFCCTSFRPSQVR